MNAEMMQKLIEFGIRQERSRVEFISQLTGQSIPLNPSIVSRTIVANVEKMPSTRRGRKPGANGLATQIRTLLGETGGTVEDIATATGEPGKKITAALNSMKARGIVSKAGKCWSLAGSNGAAV